MKANELRDGNWVRCKIYNGKNDVKIQFDIKHEVKYMHLFEPIPLTEEWLVRFGFEKSNGNQLHFDFGKLTLQLPNEKEYHKNGRVYFNSWAILEECSKYVHQLQNLYFALTGEELTIK